MGAGLSMRVCGGSVIVLGMIVIGIRVGMQRGHLADDADKSERDSDGEQALHEPSLWKLGPTVKRRRPTQRSRVDVRRKTTLPIAPTANATSSGSVGACCHSIPPAMPAGTTTRLRMP
jgi:hypothetical protein